MKQIPPNTLRTQLARSQAAGPHPDADQLTAFAENTLLDRERTTILAHLAACESCRATLQFAASEPEPASLPQPRPTRPPLRAWLPGVAIAASILAITGSSILLYHATRTDIPPTQTAKTIPPPPLPAAPAPAASSAPTLSPPANTPALSNTPKHLRARSSVPTPPEQSEEAKASPPAAPSAESTPGAISGLSTAPMRQQTSPPPSEQVQVEAQIQAELSARRSTMSAGKAASRASAAAPLQPQTALAEESRSGNAMHGAFMARPAAHAHFRINDAGQIERSTEPGIWQPVSIIQPTHFRVLSISGADIWAGGDHLRLFHSTDNGVTWTEVHLPATADRAHAIAHIRADSPQKLTIESDNGDTWTTTDNGDTWQ